MAITQLNGKQVKDQSIDLTLDITGVLPIANGGTNSSTANGGLNNLLPSQATNSGKFLQTNGTDTTWASITGSLSFTPQAIYNVKDYSATGNGSTDDTTAIQNCINACNTAGGGFIYIPRGTYIVSTKLTIYSKTVIFGDGIGVSEIRSSAYGSGATITGNTVLYGVDISNVVIESLSIRGTGKTGTSGNVINFDISTGSNKNIELRNCRFYDSAWEIVKIKQPLFSTIDSCVLESSASDGLFLYGGGTSMTIKNCYAGGITQAGYHTQLMYYSTFMGCASDSNGIGYYGETSTALTFLSCGAESAYDNSSTYSGIHFKLLNGTANSLKNCYGSGFTSGGSNSAKAHLNISGETNTTVENFRGTSSAVTGFVLPNYSYVIDLTSTVKFINPYFQNGSGGGTGSPLWEKDSGSMRFVNPSGSMNVLIAGQGGGNGTFSLSRDGTGNYGLMGFQTNLVDKWTVGLLPTTGDDFTFGNASLGGTPLYLKISNNYVGVNNTSPQTNLDIGGSMRNLPVTLTVTGTTACTVSPDASTGLIFDITLPSTATGLTINNPTNPQDGQKLMFRIKNGATGAVTLALGTSFRFGSDITAVSSIAGSKLDRLGVEYFGSASKWDIIAYTKGY